ncbi:MAG: HAMP domain-containing histidine kinase, partial [Campylobacteraceae bacterium]|nr:HAMP domain-containing histidine kinase [Campylobacteraceae bacterium]
LAEMVNKNLERTARLVRSFKQIAVDQVSENKRDFDLIEYLNGVVFSLYPEIKDTKIKINIKSAPVLILNSYPGVFSQIFTNLILNSIYHAFNKDEKGNLSIEISKSNDELKIVYKDDGKGISTENLKVIFEPFFTTDREHGRTGLGLNVVYNILTNKLRGTIKCESKEGEGVSFLLHIPL